MKEKIKSPLVSVIMPVYNGEKWVDETIGSILNQTYTNFEYIIVDDCSTDGSYKKLEEIAKIDSRIRLFKTSKNFGNPGGSGAYAIGKVSKDSKYILPIDQDDIATPYRIERSVKYMEENPDVDICGGSQRYFGTKNRYIRSRAEKDEIYVGLLTGCQFAHSTTIFRKSFLDKNNLNYKNDWGQDYRLWVEACLEYGANVHNIPDLLLYYRVHDEQNSHDNKELFKIGDNLRAYQLKKLGFEDQSELDFHNDWRGGRLKKSKASLLKIKNHLRKIIKYNESTRLYPHEALVDRMNYLYSKDLFRNKKYIKSLVYFLKLERL